MTDRLRAALSFGVIWLPALFAGKYLFENGWWALLLLPVALVTGLLAGAIHGR